LTPNRIPRAPFPFSLLSSSLIRLAALSVTTMGLRFLVLRRRGERDSSCCGMAERKRGSFFLWAVLTSDVVVGLKMFLWIVLRATWDNRDVMVVMIYMYMYSVSYEYELQCFDDASCAFFFFLKWQCWNGEAYFFERILGLVGLTDNQTTTAASIPSGLGPKAYRCKDRQICSNPVKECDQNFVVSQVKIMCPAVTARLVWKRTAASEQ
jgi:hypothetical protein